MMSMAVEARAPARSQAGPHWPLLVLAGAVALVVILSLVPLRVPIGPMYWDLFLYFDAANRIFDGQAPVLDFFAPVGPLGYYLFAGAVWLFPDAQPALLVHWSMLAVTAPAMALVTWSISRRSRGIAAAVLIPFLVFALLPFNTRDYYPFPGSDAFGIYNRHACHLLYVLAAALLFVQQSRLIAGLVTALLLALFFGKITGFISGGLLVAFAVLCGKLPLRHAIAAGLAFAAVLAACELAAGLTSRYLIDIAKLVSLNEGTLAPRFLQAASHNFGVLAAGGALVLLLLWLERHSLPGKVRAAAAERRWGDAAGALDDPALWLAVAMFAGLFFETQNTGSQAMILVWPALLAVLLRWQRWFSSPALLLAIAGLAAAAALPPFVNTIERAARTYLGGLKNVPLESRNLGTLGAVNMRPEVATRVAAMMDIYAANREHYELLVEREQLTTPLLYSDYDFQIIHLMAADRAVDSVRRLEAEHGIRFETMMAINFVNLFPWLLERSAPEHIVIGADPTRAVPDPDGEVLQAIRDTDLVLYPMCPPTTGSAMLFKLYAPALAEHRRVRLDACYDAFVHPRFGSID